MNVLAATIPNSGGGSRARLGTGTQAPRKRGVDGRYTHHHPFHRPRTPPSGNRTRQTYLGPLGANPHGGHAHPDLGFAAVRIPPPDPRRRASRDRLAWLLEPVLGNSEELRRRGRRQRGRSVQGAVGPAVSARSA